MSVLTPGDRVLIRIREPHDVEEGRAWEGVVVAADASAVRFTPEAKHAPSGSASPVEESAADKVLPWHRIASIEVERTAGGDER